MALTSHPADDPRTGAASAPFDVLIVGAGLHGGLIALALLDAHPGLRLGLIERDPRPAGNHTWCFHRGDVPADVGGWFGRLPLSTWPGYRVAFPGFERAVDLPYCGLSSADLAVHLRDVFGASAAARLLTGSEVTVVDQNAVRFADGRELRAGLVIAPRGGGTVGATGYQKFLGLERLGQIVEGTALHGVDCRFHITEGRNHHHRNRREILFDGG